ncbi:MAG: transporter [Rikenellaceae bacterium]
MSQSIKSILMLLAMGIGILFSETVAAFDAMTGGVIAPLLLFAMLFITFCCVDLRELRMSMLHVWIVLFQLVTSVILYYLLLPLDPLLAQGVMICFATPVAMAAVVIGKLLGAKAETIATFSIVSNLVMAIFIPLFFIHIGSEGCSFGLIFSRVAPVMILPPFLAQALRYIAPSITSWFGQRGYISFYLWLISLMLTIGRTVHYIIGNINDIELLLGLSLALGALLSCLIQYRIGRIFGARYGEPTAGQQSLGQKNTILAIWMTQTFLSPIASIAPASYVLWQNIINSYKIFRYKK